MNFRFRAGDIVNNLTIANGTRVSFLPSYSDKGNPRKAACIKRQPTTPPAVTHGYSLSGGMGAFSCAVCDPQPKLAPQAVRATRGPAVPPAAGDWDTTWDAFQGAYRLHPLRNAHRFDDGYPNATRDWPGKCPQTKPGHSQSPPWCPQDKPGRYEPYLTAM